MPQRLRSTEYQFHHHHSTNARARWNAACRRATHSTVSDPLHANSHPPHQRSPWRHVSPPNHRTTETPKKRLASYSFQHGRAAQHNALWHAGTLSILPSTKYWRAPLGCVHLLLYPAILAPIRKNQLFEAGLEAWMRIFSPSNPCSPVHNLFASPGLLQALQTSEGSSSPANLGNAGMPQHMGRVESSTASNPGAHDRILPAGHSQAPKRPHFSHQLVFLRQIEPTQWQGAVLVCLCPLLPGSLPGQCLASGSTTVLQVAVLSNLSLSVPVASAARLHPRHGPVRVETCQDCQPASLAWMI